MAIRKEQKKPSITAGEILQAKEDAEQAKKILESEEYEFIRSYLRDQKEEIINNTVNNKLKKIVLKKDGHDVVLERWEQEVEEAGKFKFIFQLISYLQSVVEKPSQIEKAIKEKRVEVEGEVDG